MQRQTVTGLVIAFSALALCVSKANAGIQETFSRTEESIHHEVVFTASPERVYAALTGTKQFERVSRLSAAMQSSMSLGTSPTNISRKAGGAFTLFGGHIAGRQIELAPGKRIVQAWRVANWDAGVYSIARFELSAEGSGTRLVFDHSGFPSGQAAHLAEGWRTNYWEPLEKSLSSRLSSPAKPRRQ